MLHFSISLLLGNMSAHGRGEAHSHTAAVEDTSGETWIVVVDLENVEARSVGHCNTSPDPHSILDSKLK